MRMIVALPLLLLAACNVDSDSANDQVTLEFNGERIEDAASDAAGAVGNAAESAGAAIENEVGDLEVDLDVRRNESGNAQ